MNVGWWYSPLIGLLFGCAAYLSVGWGASICRPVEPFEDGPQPGNPPTALLIGGAALVGAVIAVQGGTLPQLALAAIVTAALAGCWYCDVRVGIVPDYFTLIPLGVLLVVAFAFQEWATVVAAAAVTAPFALAAAVSRGRGMGWGDVKLVALGGAALGMQTAIVAFSAACLVAVAVAYLRKRKGVPIPFAPYLAGAMAVSLVFNVL